MRDDRRFAVGRRKDRWGRPLVVGTVILATFLAVVVARRHIMADVHHHITGFIAPRGGS